MYEFKLKNGETAILTPNELWLAEQLALDRRTAEIAQIGKINKRTLEGRIEKLRDRCGCNTIWGALVVLYKNGLIK